MCQYSNQITFIWSNNNYYKNYYKICTKWKIDVSLIQRYQLYWESSVIQRTYQLSYICMWESIFNAPKNSDM